MSNLSNFAERLNELMATKNIKSESFAKEIGVSGSNVRFWQRGLRQVSLPNLIKIADFFNCSIDFVAGRSENEMLLSPQNPPPFPQALRRALAFRGKTRYSLDKETRFKDSYIYSWDHGSPPDLVSLIELADYLDVSIDFLIGREK